MLNIKELKIGTKIKHFQTKGEYVITGIDRISDTRPIEIDTVLNGTLWLGFSDLENFEIFSQPPKLKQVILTMTEEQFDDLVQVNKRSIIFSGNDEEIELHIWDKYDNRIENFEIKDVKND